MGIGVYPTSHGFAVPVIDSCRENDKISTIAKIGNKATHLQTPSQSPHIPKAPPHKKETRELGGLPQWRLLPRGRNNPPQSAQLTPLTQGFVTAIHTKD